MKTGIVSGAIVLVSAVCLLAQSEQVKGKAKDLKRKVEAQQTNSVGTVTNAPPKPR